MGKFIEEYGLVLVGLVIGLALILFATPLGTQIKNAITQSIAKITQKANIQ